MTFPSIQRRRVHRESIRDAADQVLARAGWDYAVVGPADVIAYVGCAWGFDISRREARRALRWTRKARLRRPGGESDRWSCSWCKHSGERYETCACDCVCNVATVEDVLR